MGDVDEEIPKAFSGRTEIAVVGPIECVPARESKFLLAGSDGAGSGIRCPTSDSGKGATIVEAESSVDCAGTPRPPVRRIVRERDNDTSIDDLLGNEALDSTDILDDVVTAHVVCGVTAQCELLGPQPSS